MANNVPTLSRQVITSTPCLLGARLRSAMHGCCTTQKKMQGARCYGRYSRAVDSTPLIEPYKEDEEEEVALNFSQMLLLLSHTYIYIPRNSD